MTKASILSGLRSVPWHPFLFATIIVVTLWLDAAVSPFAVARSFVAAVGLAGLLTAICGLALRSLQLGAIAASALIWLLWSKQLLGIAQNAIDRLGAAGVLWLVGIVVAAVLVVRMLARSRVASNRTAVTSILNRVGVLLIVVAAIHGTLKGSVANAISDLEQGTDLAGWDGAPSGARNEKPDIYAILLDGYPRADVLRYAFAIDNSEFLHALAERGFEVATSAHSDYLWTHVSVPSALNMAYIEQIPSLDDVVAEREPQQPGLRYAISRNAVFDFLRHQGYDALAVGSGFEEVAARQADVWIDGGELNEFEVTLLAWTYLGDVVNVVAPDLASSQQRERILGALAVLPQIAAKRDRPPAFVFAHIPAPHQPVVFGEDGAPIVVPITQDFYADSPIERDEDPDEFRARYRAQLPYLNAEVLSTVDEIVAGAEVPPIILLFADHGSASRTDWNATDPATVDRTILLERTGTLFAALTPGERGVFPDDISPVDIFRLLFDTYFGTDYGRAAPPEGGGQIPPVDPSVLDASAAP